MTQQIAEQHAPHEHADEIHLPKPSFWPLVLGLGFGVLAFGMILGFMSDVMGTTPARWSVAGAGLLILLAAVGGWVGSNIRERAHAPAFAPVETAKFAMWCFLGTEIIIFGALIARVLVVWSRNPQAHRILVEPFTSLLLVSLNTFLLLVSSLAMVLGLSAIQRDSRRGLAGWLAVVALLGVAFVSIQGYEYNKLVHEGMTFGASQFSSAFFFLTGNHGLHVIIGVIWCLIVIARALRGGFTAHEHMGVEIFGLYWHFVDVVWIMIFTLVYLLP